ncbi:hypothetical protein BGZ70_007887 [Mortierella alpina]|uniref:C2H2-type domain-containing protein n=1 Tax=Mortierella alpina TaxID=64518 RepID=A0A9P6J586_MORAP|nr:hypothetical protein BGZ70_007887 [Mortierella alpina]
MHYLHQPTVLAASDAVSQIGNQYINMNTDTSGPQQTLSSGSLEMNRFKVLSMDPVTSLGLFSSGDNEFSHSKAATLKSSEKPSLYTYSYSGQLPTSYQSNMFDGPAPVYEPLQPDFIYQSPEFGGLSSPEVVSPASEHSLFGVSDEESYFSFVPGTMQTPHSLPFSHMNFASGSLDAAPFTTSVPPLARLSYSSSSVQYFPEASLPLSPSQPLSVGAQVAPLADLDPAMDSSNEVVENTSRRRNRAPKSRPRNKILVKYTCSQADCDVVCSSLPSLARHMQSHKWKGKYPPIRCGSCNRELSNEYSAQRHIMRSPDTSPCKRLRSYNIMCSATCIDFTVRFYPRRPHGKKTVRIELAYARGKYLGRP